MGRTRAPAEKAKGAGDRGRDTQHGPESRGEGARSRQGLGAQRGGPGARGGRVTWAPGGRHDGARGQGGEGRVQDK